ncbi:MAG TPA: hypothetical protein DD411_06215 [Alcanivorax sp.]|jgi:hypothetical protein|nr:hypothetical protein [Alcanivorax sp.]|tara:strand:+ start:9342 stop:9767 length:426 start_codon:yes stop_codon:yes gene_type:complete
MSEFSNKTDLQFEPGLSSPVAVDATGVAYQTPVPHRLALGDLARLKYRRGSFRYRVRLSGASAAGAATVRLTDGANVLASAELDLSADTEFHGAMAAKLSQLDGDDQLLVELDIGTAADASVTAEVAGALVVEHPVIIGGC